MSPSHIRSRLLPILVIAVPAGVLTSALAAPNDATRVQPANYKQANKYSNDFLKQFVYSTAVEPRWIGKTDVFWYEYRTSNGKQWYRVDPRAATKLPLCDRARLAAQLSEEVRKPLDPLLLPLATMS